MIVGLRSVLEGSLQYSTRSVLESLRSTIAFEAVDLVSRPRREHTGSDASTGTTAHFEKMLSESVG